MTETRLFAQTGFVFLGIEKVSGGFVPLRRNPRTADQLSEVLRSAPWPVAGLPVRDCWVFEWAMAGGAVGHDMALKCQ